ncbi:MAG: ABC transporter substrate-binding protein, partial [Ignavibacteria bacterium]
MTLLQNHRQLLNGSKLVLLILLVLISHLLAQEKNQFQRGIQFFNSGDYNKAIEYLEKFSGQKSEFAETANLILILSYYRLNELEKTKNFISKFETNFSNSNSLHIVLETKLAIAIIQKDFEGIKNSLIKLNKVNVKKEQVKDFASAFNKMFTFLNDQSINELEQLISNSILKFSFAKARFQNEIEKRNSSLIKKYYGELIKIGFREELLKINKIGVLIPKEIRSGSIENSIIEGLKFGVHRFNELDGDEVELKIYKGDQKTLERALVELAKDPEVLCVIGPLYSNQFKALSSLAEKICIPFISPTATASDISIKSRYIFQFNPTLDVRGYAMASYAIDRLKLTRFALLNSDNPTLKSISNEIKEKIKNSKCELIAELNWNENKKTLSSKIKELRKAAANRDLVIRFTPLLDFETEQKLISFGMKQDLIDSLKMIEAEVSIYEIFGKDAERICKSNKIFFYKRTKSIVNDLNVSLY